EAAEQLSLEREPNPDLYRMVVGALRAIAERPAPLTVAGFYWKLLANEGMRPELDTCVRCGATEPDVDFVAFDLGEGGVMCRSCRSGHPLSADALAVIRDILGGRLAHALTLDESAVTHEVAALSTHALEYHVERRMRTVAMFE
ncbi:MAG: DNA repair protein RecO C-terminal domain-containing protein, partial [Actinomycetota bacterium]